MVNLYSLLLQHNTIKLYVEVEKTTPRNDGNNKTNVSISINKNKVSVYLFVAKYRLSVVFVNIIDQLIRQWIKMNGGTNLDQR